jgi:altronate dehydratase large subunit
VKAGGTAFLEKPPRLSGRACLGEEGSNSDVAKAILMPSRTVRHWPNLRLGHPDHKPHSGEYQGGLALLEEESGAIHKAGTAPIQGVLQYAERPKGKGLYFVDNWMGSLSIFVGYAAAGTNLVMFQLGGGGLSGRNLMEGCPTVVTPFLWCTANPKTYAMAKDNIDFYSGSVIESNEDPEQAGERLYRTVIDIASGTLSRSETLFYADPVDLCLEEPRF